MEVSTKKSSAFKILPRDDTRLTAAAAQKKGQALIAAHKALGTNKEAWKAAEAKIKFPNWSQLYGPTTADNMKKAPIDEEIQDLLQGLNTYGINPATVQATTFQAISPDGERPVF